MIRHRWNQQAALGQPAQCKVCGLWKYAEPRQTLYAAKYFPGLKRVARPDCLPPVQRKKN